MTAQGRSRRRPLTEFAARSALDHTDDEMQDAAELGLKLCAGTTEQFGSDARVHRVAGKLRAEHTIQNDHGVMDR